MQNKIEFIKILYLTVYNKSEEFKFEIRALLLLLFIKLILIFLNILSKNSNFFSLYDFIYIRYKKQLYNKGEINMARVLISMPEEFLDRIDQVAVGENRTRSELIREALRTYMYKSRVKSTTLASKNAAILEALLG